MPVGGEPTSPGAQRRLTWLVNKGVVFSAITGWDWMGRESRSLFETIITSVSSEREKVPLENPSRALRVLRNPMERRARGGQFLLY